MKYTRIHLASACRIIAALFLLFAISATAQTRLGLDSPPIEAVIDAPLLSVAELIPPSSSELSQTQALNAELLSDLTLMYLSAYADDWGSALTFAESASQASDDPRVARIATILAVQGGEFDRAVTLAERWTQLDASDADAHNLRFIAWVAQGQVEQAVVYLRESGRFDEDSFDESIRKIAGLIVRQSNASAGLALMARVLELYPTNAQALLSASYVAYAFNQLRPSLQWVSSALELQPSWEAAALMQALILQRSGDEGERAKFIERFVIANPDANEMRIRYAIDLARVKRFTEALLELERVLTVDPKHQEALAFAGLIARQQDDTEAARRFYQRLKTAAPSNEEATWALAELALESQQYALAEKYFNEIQSEKNYLSAQLRIATTKVRTVGIEAALEVMRNLEPESEEQYVDIALTRHYLLVQAHRAEEALGYVNEAILTLPDNAELLYARAGAAAALRKVSVAEADYRQLLEQDPENPELLNSLGYTLADQTTRYREALVLIERALDQRPESAHIIDSFGWVKYKLGELEQAQEALLKAYELSNEPEIGIHLAEVWWVMGRRDAAIELLRAIQEVNPEHPVFKETVDRLEIEISDS